MIEEAEKQVGVVVDPDIVTDSMAASKLVCEKPCWLYSLLLSEVAAPCAVFTFYDNTVASGEVRLKLYVPGYQTLPVVFKHPVRFKRGFYLEFTTSGAFASVQYKPDY